ncbi:MAG: hypothetical protein LC099_03160 [Anaerolineales bacterium]|nr:hypothetical protein [Anaerolineales bacterium]
MSIEYDDKGKYYTEIIHKTPLPAAIQTAAHLIRGTIYVRLEGRLKDELENTELFLAVTDANVQDASGATVYASAFLAIRKDQIIWVMPLDDENKKGDEE